MRVPRSPASKWQNWESDQGPAPESHFLTTAFCSYINHECFQLPLKALVLGDVDEERGEMVTAGSRIQLLAGEYLIMSTEDSGDMSPEIRFLSLLCVIFRELQQLATSVFIF